MIIGNSFRRMVARTTTLFLLIISSASGLAAPPATLSPDDKKAYQTVAAAGQFCSEGVGEAGITPPVLVTFRALSKNPQADAAFKQLLVDATTAGKLYALCGVYYTDPAFFEKAVQPFRHSREEVPTVMGCIISRDTVGSIVEQSGPAAVRLKTRSQTIKQWAEETKPASMRYDIIGGGWPDVFKESGGYRTR